MSRVAGTSGAPSLAQLAAATPATRDRWIDFVRGASLLVVVLGHWLIALIWWTDGVIRATSAVGRTPGLWLATWAFQVMPLFFFVGGASNLLALEASHRHGSSTWSFMRGRVRRLLVPSMPLVAAWALVQLALHLLDVGAPTGPRLPGAGVVLLRGVRPPGQTIPFGPLWFLGAYLVVVAASPVTIAAHRRFRWRVPAALAAGAVAVDVVGFAGGHPRARYLNVALVLLLPHQLGHFYGDGTMQRWGRRVPAAMAAIGLGGLLVLTNGTVFEAAGGRRFDWFPGIGHYPRSLLGTDVESVSNAYPPTLCFLLGGVWLIGLALLLRPALTRWLALPLPWRATVAVNARAMTLFLWHMTAYLLAILVLLPLGLGHEHAPTLRWWLERPAWVIGPAVALAALVGAFGRFEASGHAPRPRPGAVAGERAG